MPVEGITGGFWVSDVKENGEKLVELCTERGMVIVNTWFKKRCVHKITRVSGVGGQRALMDYMLIERCAKDRLTDVSVQEGRQV